MKTRIYARLSEYEREMISRGLGRGETLGLIAEGIGRHLSTVSREVRKGTENGRYCTDCATRSARKRASSRRCGKYKMEANAELSAYVMAKLSLLWSPEQIAERLRTEYPQDTDMSISKDSIYRYLYVKPKTELRKLLRHGHIRRRKRGRPKGGATVGKIQDMAMIDERPKEVASRLVPGHWEGDLIKGKYNKSALGTLVERTTRYTVLVPLPHFDAGTVRKSFAKELLSLPEDIRRTLTYDQGKEMADHLELALDTDMQVYFAHSRSPWERGTSENTNGLIRQFFPKGTDFTKVSRREIKKVQALLNDRPRKCLSFKKPDEVLSEVLR